MANATETTISQRGFTIVRHLDAPRELVFEAWTDPNQLRWFAATGPPVGKALDLPLSTCTSLVLGDLGGATEMTLQVAFPEDLSDEEVVKWLDTGMVDGWNQILVCLDPYLTGSPTRPIAK